MTLIKFNRPTKSFVSPMWNNVFNDFFNDNLPFEQANYTPAVNIIEGKTNYEIQVSAPGFEKDNFKLSIEKDVLSLSGEHKTETTEIDVDKRYSRKEFSFGSFKRSWTLPGNANTDKINAIYENGILKLEIPKITEEHVIPAREIKIG